MVATSITADNNSENKVTTSTRAPSSPDSSTCESSPNPPYLSIRRASVADIYDGFNAADLIASSRSNSEEGSLTGSSVDSDVDEVSNYDDIYMQATEEEDAEVGENGGLVPPGMPVKLRKRKGVGRRSREGRKIHDYIEY